MYTPSPRYRFGPSLTPMVRNLLLLCGVVYLVQMITSRSNGIEGWLALWPQQVINRFALWQLVTYLFLHGSLLHLVFNLFTLWMFGCDVERALGSKRFIWYFLITGVGAGLFHLAFNWNSLTPVIGASGAIYGVLVAFAVLFPNREITLLVFFVLPVRLKAKYLAAIFMTISLIAGIQGQILASDGGVAHLAHLGGGLVGFILLRGTTALQGVLFEMRKRAQWRKMAKQKRKEEKKQLHRVQIDELLDKINQVGYTNLTAHEKAMLKKAAEQLADEK